MTAEQHGKLEFLRLKLMPLCLSINPAITDMRYNVTNQAETVVIVFDNGLCKYVGVTADSTLAMAQDVLERIG